MDLGPLELREEDCLLFSKLCHEISIGVLILDTHCLSAIRPLFINPTLKAILEGLKDVGCQEPNFKDGIQDKLLAPIFTSLSRSLSYKTNILQALSLKPEVAGPTHICHIIPLEAAERFQDRCLMLFEAIPVEESSGPSSTLGRCIEGLTHDFNNLLMIINAYAELLKLKLGPQHEAYEYLGPIQNASLKAGTLVEQMRQMGSDAFHTKKIFNLKDTVLEIKNILEHTLSEPARIDIKTELKDAFIEANPGEIEQALTNLCLNAKQAMPRGGTMTIRLEPEPDGRHVCLSVEDQGKGIDPSIQEHLFEPNFTTKAHKLGHGFGLFNIASIVKKLEGFIEVKSVPEKGSTFQLFFKQASFQKNEALKDTKPAQKNVSSKKLILVVEPNEAEREKLLILLNASDYKAVSYEENLDILACNARAAALCLGPNVKGSGVSSLLGEALEKSLRRHPHLKIISLSQDPTIEKHLKDRYYSRLFCFPNLTHSVQILKVLPSILNIDIGLLR